MLEAPINYLVPMDEKPTYFLDPPPGTAQDNVSYDLLTVPIYNARVSNPSPSIEREGFEVVGHHTAVADPLRSGRDLEDLLLGSGAFGEPGDWGHSGGRVRLEHQKLRGSRYRGWHGGQGG